MNNYFEVSFGSILPKNLAEDLQNLSTAGGGKPINSQETLTARSPYTQNVKEEIEKMKQEEQAASVNERTNILRQAAYTKDIGSAKRSGQYL